MKNGWKENNLLSLLFYNNFYFISFYASVISSLYHILIIKKIKRPVAGVPRRRGPGPPCHGTSGTMGNPALLGDGKLLASSAVERAGFKPQVTNPPQSYHILMIIWWTSHNVRGSWIDEIFVV